MYTRQVEVDAAPGSGGSVAGDGGASGDPVCLQQTALQTDRTLESAGWGSGVKSNKHFFFFFRNF